MSAWLNPRPNNAVPIIGRSTRHSPDTSRLPWIPVPSVGDLTGKVGRPVEDRHLVVRVALVGTG